MPDCGARLIKRSGIHDSIRDYTYLLPDGYDHCGWSRFNAREWSLGRVVFVWWTIKGDEINCWVVIYPAPDIYLSKISSVWLCEFNCGAACGYNGPRCHTARDILIGSQLAPSPCTASCFMPKSFSCLQHLAQFTVYRWRRMSVLLFTLQAHALLHLHRRLAKGIHTRDIVRFEEIHWIHWCIFNSFPLTLEGVTRAATDIHCQLVTVNPLMPTVAVWVQL